MYVLEKYDFAASMYVQDEYLIQSHWLYGVNKDNQVFF